MAKVVAFRPLMVKLLRVQLNFMRWIAFNSQWIEDGIQIYLVNKLSDKFNLTSQRRSKQSRFTAFQSIPDLNIDLFE